MKGNNPLENVAQKIEKSIPGAIKIDEKEVFDHLDTLVRQSVEDTINSLLDAEADAICNANRYHHLHRNVITPWLTGGLATSYSGEFGGRFYLSTVRCTVKRNTSSRRRRQLHPSSLCYAVASKCNGVIAE